MDTHVRERGSHVSEFAMIETTGLRHRIETAIDSLIALLDTVQGDPDLEAGGDELDASFPEEARQFDGRFAEEDCEDVGDHEPSLGSPDFPFFGGQGRWGESSRCDGEADAGEEPEVDAGDEPEIDPAERGVADRDAMDLWLDESEAIRAFQATEQERLEAHQATRKQLEIKLKGRRTLRSDPRWRWR